MTRCAELTTPAARTPAIAVWIRTVLTRLPARRSRRLTVIDPERWSQHLLRDIGLAE